MQLARDSDRFFSELLRAGLHGNTLSGYGKLQKSSYVFARFRISTKFYLKRGGELFNLSREMGHSTVQITEIYLKDYRSSEARREHQSYSPIGEVKLPSRNRRKSRKED